MEHCLALERLLNATYLKQPRFQHYLIDTQGTMREK